MADLIGQQIGRFRILRLISSGGMASTYLAVDTLFDERQVALEISPVHSNEQLQRKEREFKILAQLDHANILPTFDFGREAELFYLVNQYIPEGTLRQRHPLGTSIPLPTVISYVKQIASALQYLHDRGIVHRNVKPENMFVDSDGKILLSGFSIAITLSDEASDEQMHMAGTLPYMAPEQFQGKVQRASDQYALGIVVYEWLSGERPFVGNFVELMQKEFHVQPPSLRAIVPELPPEVEQVVFIALAKDPSARFASVKAFANALEQASRSPLGAPPAPVPSSDDSPTYRVSPGSILGVNPAPDHVQRDSPTSPGSSSYSEPVWGASTGYPDYPVANTFLPPLGNSLPAYPGYVEPGTPGADQAPPLVQGSPPPSSSGHIGPSTPPASSGHTEPSTPTVGKAPLSVPGDVPSGPLPTLADHLRERDSDRVFKSIPSPKVQFSSVFRRVGNTLTKLFSGRGSKKQRGTELSLFAVARTTLEEDDRAIVGNTYTVQAGISQRREEQFRSASFEISVQDPLQPILFHILFHLSDNIELMGASYQHLSYNPSNAEPQLISCPFRLKASGQSYLLINFYRERQWLQTMRFEFDCIERPVPSTAGSGR